MYTANLPAIPVLPTIPAVPTAVGTQSFVQRATTGIEGGLQSLAEGLQSLRNELRGSIMANAQVATPALATPVTQQAGGTADSLFRAMDSNGDNFLSRGEFANFLTRSVQSPTPQTAAPAYPPAPAYPSAPAYASPAAPVMAQGPQNYPGAGMQPQLATPMQTAYANPGVGAASYPMPQPATATPAAYPQAGGAAPAYPTGWSQPAMAMPAAHPGNGGTAYPTPSMQSPAAMPAAPHYPGASGAPYPGVFSHPDRGGRPDRADWAGDHCARGRAPSHPQYPSRPSYPSPPSSPPPQSTGSNPAGDHCSRRDTDASRPSWPHPGATTPTSWPSTTPWRGNEGRRPMPSPDGWTRGVGRPMPKAAEGAQDFKVLSNAKGKAIIDLGGDILELNGPKKESILRDKATGNETKVWGDPHFEANGQKFDFKNDLTLRTEDGAHVTIRPEKGTAGLPVTDNVVVSKNGRSMQFDFDGSAADKPLETTRVAGVPTGAVMREDSSDGQWDGKKPT